AILAVVLGLIVVSIIRRQFLQGISLGLLGAIPVLALTLVLPGIFDTVTSRFRTIHEDRGSDRLDIWNAAIQVFKDHPVIGIGADNFKTGVGKVYGVDMMPHSIYIGTAVELGFIGLILLLSWIGVLLVKAWRSPERIWLFPLLIAYLFQSAFL